MTDRLLLRRASLRPGERADIVIADGRIAEIVPSGIAPAGRSEAVDLAGRPLLPGLVDHHVHLFALAASLRSVDLSPGALVAAGGLDAALRAGRSAAPDGWLRGVGYDVAASGPLDRRRLDAIGVGPVRVQDRTGILWILDSRGLDAVLPPDRRDWPEGIERVDGEATGVLRRSDHWLGHRVPSAATDLAAVGRLLASFGITAVMDAGADNDERTLRALAAADLPLRVHAMTRESHVEPVEGVALGPVKVLLDDEDLPGLDDLTARLAGARAAGRSVAVHCVSEVQLAVAVAAGIGREDRVEHASLVPADLLTALVAAGPTVVLQPGLVRTRGDRYLQEVDPADHPGLHRLRSFRDAGLRIAASSDAPYGSADPWVAITAAVERTTAEGRTLGDDEAMRADEALALFTGALEAPSEPRQVEVGHPGDLVVLDADWQSLAHHPPVAATLVAGRVAHGALPS